MRIWKRSEDFIWRRSRAAGFKKEEMSLGVMMFSGGIAGAALCLILLLSSWKLFAVQRKKLLEFLEKM